MGINIELDSKTDINEVIRLLLFRNKVTIAELSRRMSELSGKNYTRFNLRAKLENKSIKFNEALLIFEILGYHFKLLE
ncbi:MAG: hypothetical protein K2F57_01565 [Candidatus Gastranaerophilales bacterium]|nr:hypothetical protein [Candidatus Gastranaerophilales bacterium]